MLSNGSARLSVVVVTYNSRDSIGAVLGALRRELAPDDEVVVVDNASTDGTVDAVRAAAPEALVVALGENVGFAAGCNAGAARATGDLLVLLNPDAVPAPGFGEAIRRPLRERRWGAWMGLVTQEGGALVNSSGGVVHFTGIAWAGEAGRPVAEVAARPREVGFVSGACAAIPRATWVALGGFPPQHFMYYEDVDLSLRVRLAGGRLGLVPDALVVHEYEFDKGSAKWRHLERNRWATIVRTYPGPVLAVVAPALVATEVAVLLAAARGGWLREKLGAWREVAGALPRLAAERRRLQRERAISAAEFAAGLRAGLDSSHLPGAGGLRRVDVPMRVYWALARRLLGRPRAPHDAA